MDIKLPTNRPPLIFWLFIIVLVIALALGGAYLYLLKTGGLPGFFNKSASQDKNIWEPARSSPLPLPPGKQTYQVSGSLAGPKISEIVFDPLDPKVGENQTVSIKILKNAPASEVKVTLAIDGEAKEYTLKKTSGDENSDTWQATWKIGGEYKNTYSFVIAAKGDSGSSRLEYPFR